MKHKWFTQRNAITLLAIVYLVGILGFILAPEIFEHLTPVNLITAALVVFMFHKNWSGKFIAFAITAALCGFWVEWAGVNTGVIFGEYAYGGGLGWKLFEIPPLIGLNWLLLLYCCGTIADFVKVPWWAQAAIGAGLMILLDYFIEPFAIQYDLWDWAGGTIPLQNFVSWYIVSLLLLLPFHYFRLAERNRVAVALYILQLIFFASLLLFL